MATIASLIVNIGANTAGFAAGLVDAKKETAGFESYLGQLGKSFAPAAIATAAVAGIKTLIDQGEAAIVTQTKMAYALGISTEMAAGLSLGAKRLGVDTGVLTGGFRHLQQQLAEAGIAGSEAEKKFAKFGIDTQQLKSGDLIGNLGVIEKQIQSMGDASQRMNAEMELFGKHGMEAAKLARGGEAALQGMALQAKAAGLSFNELEGRRVLEGAKAWKSAMVDVRSVVDNIAQKLAMGTAGTTTADIIGSVARQANTEVNDLTRGLDILFLHWGNATAAARDYAKELEKAKRLEEGRIRGEDRQQQLEADRRKAVAIAELNRELEVEIANFNRLGSAKKIAEVQSKTGATDKELRGANGNIAQLDALQYAKEYTQLLNQQMIASRQVIAERRKETDGLTLYAINLQRVAEGKRALSKLDAEQITWFERDNRQYREATAMIDGNMTALERFNQEMKRASALKQVDKLTTEQYDRQVLKLTKDLMQTAGVMNLVNSAGPGHTAGGGSLEADKLIAQADRNAMPRGIVEDIGQKQLIQQQLQVDLLGQIKLLLQQPQFVVASKG